MSIYLQYWTGSCRKVSKHCIVTQIRVGGLHGAVGTKEKGNNTCTKKLPTFSPLDTNSKHLDETGIGSNAFRLPEQEPALPLSWPESNPLEYLRVCMCRATKKDTNRSQKTQAASDQVHKGSFQQPPREDIKKACVLFRSKPEEIIAAKGDFMRWK